jgi:hypothetical protein
MAVMEAHEKPRRSYPVGYFRPSGSFALPPPASASSLHSAFLKADGPVIAMINGFF